MNQAFVALGHLVNEVIQGSTLLISAVKHYCVSVFKGKGAAAVTGIGTCQLISVAGSMTVPLRSSDIIKKEMIIIQPVKVGAYSLNIMPISRF